MLMFDVELTVLLGENGLSVPESLRILRRRNEGFKVGSESKVSCRLCPVGALLGLELLERVCGGVETSKEGGRGPGELGDLFPLVGIVFLGFVGSGERARLSAKARVRVREVAGCTNELAVTVGQNDES